MIEPFVSQLSADAPVPKDLPDDQLRAFLDLCHYLTLAYSWYQLQTDRFPAMSWSWSKWFLEYGKYVRAILSWNYDLEVERLLRRSQVPFFYAGFDNPVQRGQSIRAKTRAAIPVAKPHGSCNFAPARGVEIRAADYDGDPGEPMSYPRQLHVTGYDGPMRALPDHELHTIRQVADVVLPGEWNRFRNYISWVGRAYSEFERAASTCNVLVVVGFRMAPPDRAEFEQALESLYQLERAYVVDPSPNQELMGLLSRRAPEVVVLDDALPPRFGKKVGSLL